MEIIKYVLEFTFQSFWHWLGVFLIVSSIFNGIYGMFKTPVVIKSNKDNDSEQ